MYVSEKVDKKERTEMKRKEENRKEKNIK